MCQHLPPDTYLTLIASSSYNDFADHLHTNTIGPIICANRLLAAGISIGSIVFVSSDSGSAIKFRAFEDGFVQNMSPSETGTV